MKSNSYPSLRKTVSAILASTLLAGSVHAAVVVTTTVQGGTGYAVASSTDLLQTAFGTYTGTLDTVSGAQPESRVRDGLGLSTDPSAPRINSGSSATYTLDLSTNTLGYTLNSIDIFFGHSNGGRDEITSFNVQYATVSAPTTFITALSGGSSVIGASPFYGRARVADDTLSSFATNVAAIRITFTTVENGWSTLKEIDVNGSPVVIPEPTSALLGGIGLLFLLRRRR
ncbi:hypothetical protein [Haloferula sp. A504]|uniref:hypothetical protein n=1 Tax=Haloferula sp. A504 TaxID=3373601 RepID=UPI0031C5194C|nr:hypothetical protein [Verrucomicrobiaceae bacterium E54]